MSKIKEIQLSPNIAINDYNVKLNKAIGFLKNGIAVKVVLMFKGREMKFVERGEHTILSFADKVQEYGRMANMPTLNGKRMMFTINPKKK